MPDSQLQKMMLAVLLAVFPNPYVHGQPPQGPPAANTSSQEKSSKPFRAGKDGLAPAKCTYMPNPPYTKEAKKAKYSGVVLVEGTIMPDGKVEYLKIVRSPGLGLDQSTLKTIKAWRCDPVIGPNGTAVPALVEFEINFRLY